MLASQLAEPGKEPTYHLSLITDLPDANACSHIEKEHKQHDRSVFIRLLIDCAHYSSPTLLHDKATPLHSLECLPLIAACLQGICKSMICGMWFKTSTLEIAPSTDLIRESGCTTKLHYFKQ